jgi:translation initiation factor 4G
MSVCKERPETLPPLDTIGLEPVDQSLSLTRGGSGRHRQSSNPNIAPPSNRALIGLGFGNTAGLGKSGPGGSGGPNVFGSGMGNFATQGSKLNGDDRFMSGTGRVAFGPSGLSYGGRPQPPVVRAASQGGFGAVNRE